MSAGGDGEMPRRWHEGRRTRSRDGQSGACRAARPQHDVTRGGRGQRAAVASGAPATHGELGAT